MFPPCEAALPTCASVPHPMVQVFVYRCPHRGQWVAWVTTGSTDEPKQHPAKTFGPFDTAIEVASEVSSQLGREVLLLNDREPGPST